MTILLIVIASLASVLVQSTTSEIDANNRFTAQVQDRTALDKIRRELHCASSVSARTRRTALTAGTAYSAIATQLSSVSPERARYDDLRHLVHGGQHVDDRRLRALSRDLDLRAADLQSSRQDRVGRLPADVDAVLPPSSSTACSGVLKPTASLPMLHIRPARGHQRADLDRRQVQPRRRHRAAERDAVVTTLRRRLHPRREEGFTLVELLIAMIVLTVGILALVAAYTSGYVALNRRPGSRAPGSSPTPRWSASGRSATPTSG